MARDEGDRLGYCHEVLLLIWEKWTTGEPSLRRFLEHLGDDQAGHEQWLHLLIQTTGQLRRLGQGSPGAEAALLVAGASMKAYVGVPEREAVRRALAAEREASDRAPV